MEVSPELKAMREKLLELDKKKAAIEKDIMTLTEALSGLGMPGTKNSIIRA